MPRQAVDYHTLLRCIQCRLPRAEYPNGSHVHPTIIRCVLLHVATNEGEIISADDFGESLEGCDDCARHALRALIAEGYLEADDKPTRAGGKRGRRFRLMRAKIAEATERII